MPPCRATVSQKRLHKHGGNHSDGRVRLVSRRWFHPVQEKWPYSPWEAKSSQRFCERISLRGLCRTAGVSLTWLLHLLVECLTASPAHLNVQSPVVPRVVMISRLEAEADECGASYRRRRTNNGSRSSWMRPLAQSLPFMRAIGAGRVAKSSVLIFCWPTVTVPRFTRINMSYMRR